MTQNLKEIPNPVYNTQQQYLKDAKKYLNKIDTTNFKDKELVDKIGEIRTKLKDINIPKTIIVDGNKNDNQINLFDLITQ